MAQKKKNKGGRPTKMTDEVLSKLEMAFASGFTDDEACLYADISPSTLERYCEKNQEFRTRKELLKKQPNMRAKLNIAEDLKKQNVDTSKWVLERRDPDYAKRVRGRVAVSDTGDKRAEWLLEFLTNE